MNNKNVILASAAALVAVIAVSGFAFSSFAADTDTDTITTNTNQERSYGRGGMGRNLTDEQRAELEAKRDEHRAAMEAAMDSGYDAWAKLVTEEVGADAAILDTINAGNFARFQEGHELMEQGRDIMEELGVEGGFMGMGKGKGMMGGSGRGQGMPCGMDTTNNSTLTQ